MAVSFNFLRFLNELYSTGVSANSESFKISKYVKVKKVFVKIRAVEFVNKEIN